MLKLKYFKITHIIILVLLLFCAGSKTAYAFFSPSSLQLLSASIGTVGHIIVVLITAIISFGIKLKRGKIKKILFVSLFSGLFICVIVVGWRFYNFKKLNSLPTTNNWIQEIRDNYFSNREGLDRLVDLSQISKSEYDEFKKINLNPGQKLQLINDDLEINIFDLRKFIMTNEIGRVLAEHGIAQKDKLLIYCKTGATSASSAYHFNQLGYDAYYTELKQLKDKNYVKFNGLSLSATNLPIIVPLKEEKDDKNYIFFMFHSSEKEICDPEIYPKEIRGKLRKIVVWPKWTLKNQQCDVEKAEFNEIFDEHSKIVCLNKIDCILTQHYLDYLNLTNKFRRVCFIEK